MPNQPSNPITRSADVLIDGSSPVRPDQVLDRLSQLGIEADTHHHPPLFTVADAETHRGSIPGARLKNLFLRNKKGKMWLLALRADRQLDLRKEVGAIIGTGRLSFGSEQRLMHYLGVTPGAVTPLAVINDVSHAVEVVIDKVLLQHDLVNVHPLDNTMTTTLSPAGLLRFLEAEGHPPQIVGFD